MSSEEQVCNVNVSIDHSVATFYGAVLQLPVTVLNRSSRLREAVKNVSEDSNVSLDLPQDILDAWLYGLQSLKVDLRIPDKQQVPKALKEAVSYYSINKQLQAAEYMGDGQAITGLSREASSRVFADYVKYNSKVIAGPPQTLAKGISELSADLRRSVLAACTVPLPVQIAMLPEDLHVSALQAAHPGMRATHSLIVPYRWASREYGSACWKVLGTQTDLRSLDCSYTMFEGRNLCPPHVPEEFFSCVAALTNLKCLSVAWLDLSSREVLKILNALNPALLERLDLSASVFKKMMTVAVASALGKFTALKELSISMSGINSSVVQVLGDSIAQLQQLQVLNIANCSASAPELNIFRKKLSFCANIQEFCTNGSTCPAMCVALPCTMKSLHVKEFSTFSSLAPHIYHLTQLTELRLSESSEQSSADISGIANCVSTSMNLAVLHLSGSSITVEGAAALARLLPELKSLEDLSISIEEPRFTVTGYPVDGKEIASALSRVPQLLHVALCGFHIGERAGKALCKSVSGQTALRTLKLDHSKVKETAAEMIASHLAHVPDLQHLHVSCCSLKSGGYSAFAQNLGKCSDLKVLSLSTLDDYGVFSEQGWRAFSSQLSSLKSLEELYLKHQLMGYVGIKAIADPLKCCTALKRLDFSSNNLDDDAIEALAPSFDSLRALQCINLSSNRNLTSNAVEFLARYVTRLVHLEHLQLSMNRICDKGLECLAECIRGMPSLNVVSLNLNRIECFDEEIRECPHASLVLRGLDDQEGEISLSDISDDI